MKNVYASLFVVMMLSAILGCSTRNDLEGRWERVGDKFEGMQILVEEQNGSFKAEIVEVTAKPEGFAVGDIKWRNIKQVAEDQYEFENLGKSLIYDSNKYEGIYVPCRLEIDSEGLIHTRLFSKGSESLGTETNWKRLNGS